jgi:colanic acid/amylovoran biosynthesis glycosyltransferase
MKREGNMKELKLAYIIGSYPGVTKTFIDREIKTLRQWEVDIQTVSIRRPSAKASLSAEQQKLQEGTIYVLPANWPRFFLSHFYFALFHFLTYFKTLLYLLSRSHPSRADWFKTVLHFGEGVYAAYLLRDQSVDRIHAHFIDRAATVALIIGRLLDRPYSVTAHANDIYTKKVLLYEKLDQAEFSVTVSEFNKSYLLDTYPDLDADRIHVLHPWIDMSRFQPPPTRPAHDALRILSVGRLVEKKGHGYLIKACHLLRTKGIDLECRIIGSGPLKSELEADIERYELQDCVHLLGAQPQSEVLANLVWCDVFALACVIAKDGDRDGMPVSLAEAMAMSVPVVSCRIVGIDELVRPQAGLLVPTRDATALAEALQAIYDLGQSDRIEMGRQGRAVVDEDFDLHKGTRQLMALFQGAQAFE